MTVTGGKVEAYRDGGLKLTCAAAGAITAGNVVVLTGTMVNGVPQVDVAGALATKLKGVATQTCDTAGDLITVAFPGSMSYKLVAAGAIDAGDEVVSAAAGKVSSIAAVDNTNAGTVATGVTGSRAILGYAFEDIADTASGRVILV